METSEDVTSPTPLKTMSGRHTVVSSSCCSASMLLLSASTEPATSPFIYHDSAIISHTWCTYVCMYNIHHVCMLCVCSYVRYCPTKTGSFRTSRLSIVPPASPAAWASNALLDAVPTACFRRRCRASATSLFVKINGEILALNNILWMYRMYVLRHILGMDFTVSVRHY